MKSVLLFLLLFSGYSFSQIEGRITSSKSREAIKEANILIEGRQQGTSSDKNGIFFLENLFDEKITLIFSHIGFHIKKIEVEPQPGKIFLEVKLDPSNVSLGEITVISTKYEKAIQDIPLPLEAADKENILKGNAFTSSDILKALPGVSMERDGAWSTSVNIRGMNKSSIVALIDGNRIETATDHAAVFSLIDLNDIKRIEVIKGPASSLYGTGATGGVVNFISIPAAYSSSFNLSGSAAAGYTAVNSSNFENIILKGSNNFLTTKLTGSIRTAENIKTAAGEIFNSGYKDKYLSGLVGIRLLTGHEIKFNYQNFTGKDIGIPGGYPLFNNSAKVSYKFIKRDLTSIEYSIKNLFPSLTKLSLRFFNQNIYRDVENIPDQVSIKPAEITYVNKITPKGKHFTSSIQLNTSWLIAKNNIAAAGVDIWQRNIASSREKFLRIVRMDTSSGHYIIENRIIGELPLPEASFRSAGFYLQDEIFLIPKKLSLTISGRVDHILASNKEMRNPDYIIINGIRNDNSLNKMNLAASEKKDISWSANISLLYSITESLDFTFNLARSFRSPSLEERYQYIDLGSRVRIGNPFLEPEEGSFTDIGIRIRENNFALRLNAFINYIQNLVVEIPGAYEDRPAAIKSNAGKSLLHGFDFNTEYSFIPDNKIYLTSSYVNGRYIEMNVHLPQIPPFNGRAGYKLFLLKNIYFDFSAIFFASQYKTAAGESATPGYVYFDLYVNTIPFNINYFDLSFSAGIENVFNKDYRNHLSTNRGLIVSEPGRNIFLKINASF